MRLRDSTGVAWAVRWDEATDRFTVTDTRSPAWFTLGGASSQGSGPSGPTVTLTLTLTAGPDAAGTTFTIDASATDDLGAADEFRPGGTVIVVGPAEQHRDKTRKLTELERWQRAHSNAGSREDERIEGDVLAADCRSDPKVITVGNRDGAVRLELRGEAADDCEQVQPGQYLEGTGEKLTEEQFRVDQLNAR